MTTVTLSDLGGYEPPDVQAAHEQWGATCGPCAFAAVNGITLAQARRCFPLVTLRRTWVNPTQMRHALDLLGQPYTVHGAASRPAEPQLVLIQFGGPWLLPSVPPAVAYRYTHWVAFRPSDRAVWDANLGWWTTEREWKAEIADDLMRNIKRCDGTLSVKLRLAIIRSDP